jgi:hypothetical protein
MKFTLNKNKNPSQYWNGIKSLPDEINVLSYNQYMAELELLAVICTLHGYITAFDILTGSDNGTDKDNDINSVLTAFQMYLLPKMPLSNYSGSNDKRIKNQIIGKVVPINPDLEK